MLAYYLMYIIEIQVLLHIFMEMYKKHFLWSLLKNLIHDL